MVEFPYEIHSSKPLISGSNKMYTEEYTRAVEFCYHDIKGDWYKELRRFWFKSAEDAIVFKLKFG